MCNYRSTYHPFCGHTTNPILFQTCEEEVKAMVKGKAKAICSLEDAKYLFCVTSARGACDACEQKWQVQGFVSADPDPEAVERRRKFELKQPPKRELTPLEKMKVMRREAFADWTARFNSSHRGDWVIRNGPAPF
ncbi:hypothetical protein BP5796_10167 [Coleophoma crateriformis]|uniref:Uncharacterized protein n=1 Tax=Coleophoma crateriformis TaxID=565419 RepID=A0A3D8QUM9_9HELO|nr:hypothetical protein BP5796_10167 [Coleophoma crateriformis]